MSTKLVVTDFLETGGCFRIIEAQAMIRKQNNWLVCGLPSNGPVDYEKKVATKVFRTRVFSLFFLERQSINFFKIFFGVFKTLWSVPINSYKEVELHLPISGLATLLHPYTWLKKKSYYFHGLSHLEYLQTYRVKNFSELGFSLSEIRMRILACWLYCVQRMVLMLSDEVYIFSFYSEKLLQKHFGFKKVKKIKVPFIKLPLSVGKKLAFIPKNTQLIVVPSRIEFRKGIHLVVAVAKQLQDFFRDQNVKILLSGPAGGDYGYFTDLVLEVKENGLNDFVWFIPTQERNVLFSLYKQAKLTLIPSLDLETFGLVTVESLLQKTPVIGFSNGATTEIITTIDSRLLVKNISAKALAHKIKWYFGLSANNIEKIKVRTSNVTKLLDIVG